MFPLLSVPIREEHHKHRSVLHGSPFLYYRSILVWTLVLMCLTCYLQNDVNGQITQMILNNNTDTVLIIIIKNTC